MEDESMKIMTMYWYFIQILIIRITTNSGGKKDTLTTSDQRYIMFTYNYY